MCLHCFTKFSLQMVVVVVVWGRRGGGVITAENSVGLRRRLCQIGVGVCLCRTRDGFDEGGC